MVAEKAKSLLDRLEKTTRLRLQREHDLPAAPLPQFDEPCDMPSHMVCHQTRRVRARPRDALEGARHGRDRTNHPLGQQRGKQSGSAIRVGKALRCEPVRLVDILLHPATMKWSVRKRIDGEDVEIVTKQIVSKYRKGFRRAQCLGSDRRKAQSDAERRVRRYLGFDVEEMRLKTSAHLVPRFSCMDVGAVGEMDVAGKMIKLHDRRSSPEPLAFLAI